MRISRVQLAGLAVVLAGGAAQEAAADDLTISTATTTPVVTSNANSGAGDVTITNTGSITIDAGETAITVDSNNDVSNDGEITANNADNVTGIRITDGFAATVTNSGEIRLVEDNTFTDPDGDGDPEGEWALGTGRFGIHQDGNFSGAIINSGTINAEADGARGIWIDGTLTGDLTSSGSVVVTGDDAVGILIEGAGVGVTGDVLISGSVNGRGANVIGVLVDSAIGGELSINGNFLISGFANTQAPADQSNLDPAPDPDLIVGGAAIHIRDSIVGGVTIEGTGVEDDEDDDEDGVTDDTDADDNNTAFIASFGPAPALLIEADGSNIALGDTGNGFGLVNRGTLQGFGLYEGFSGTGLRLEGIGGATIDTTGGILNDHTIQAAGSEADAYGIYIGDGVTAPLINNRNGLSGSIVSTGTDTAYALHVAGGSAPEFINSGRAIAQATGLDANAVTIFDATGTLTSITNMGTISAVLFPIDDDPTDFVVPTTNGDAVAIDVSNAAGAVLLEQLPDVPFTDQDAVDGDVNGRPQILINGDIRLGAFGDTFNLEAGAVRGDLFFGAGADTFLIDGEAEFVGALTDSDGQLNITVNDGVLDIRGGDVNGEVNITNALFSSDSTLRVLLSETAADSTLIQASGTVTFEPDATLRTDVPVGLPVGDTLIFLTANSLVGGANVVDANVTGDGVPFIYNLAIELVDPLALDGDANGLQAVYALKSASELGLTANQTAAFDPLIEALRLDSAAAAAFTALDNQAAFDDAYEDLMPSFSSAAAELAATAIQQAQGASGNRLAAVRMQGLDEVSVWAQEIGYAVSREPPSLNGQEFSGHGFGMAVGIDGPLDNGAIFGLSASLVASEVEEEGRPDGEIAVTLGQVGAYLGTALGPVDLDFVAGLGAGKLSSQRVVEIGDAFSAQSEAEWWAYQGHGMARASVPLRLGNSFVITPLAALTYVYLAEDGYEEVGGGAAIDYEVSDATSQRLWGDAGIEFSARMRGRGQTVISPRLFVGYRTNLIDEEAERSFRFVSGGDEFTLTDEEFGDGGALFGLGIDATNGYSTFALGYEGEFGDQIERHSINASIRFRF